QFFPGLPVLPGVRLIGIEDAIAGSNDHDTLGDTVEKRWIEKRSVFLDRHRASRLATCGRRGRKRDLWRKIPLDQHLQQVAVTMHAPAVVGFLLQQLDGKPELRLDTGRISDPMLENGLEQWID